MATQFFTKPLVLNHQYIMTWDPSDHKPGLSVYTVIITAIHNKHAACGLALNSKKKSNASQAGPAHFIDFPCFIVKCKKQKKKTTICHVSFMQQTRRPDAFLQIFRRCAFCRHVCVRGELQTTIDSFVLCCKNHFLHLNVNKSEGMMGSII